MTKENLFFDYGGLIVNYDFNKQTLFRAHNLALRYINSATSQAIELADLSNAHDSAIQAYLQARKDNSEWSMDRIMGLMLNNLGVGKRVSMPRVSLIYKLNDHDVSLKGNALEVLNGLSRTSRLNIITNLPHDSVLYELQKFGMLGFFSTITMSHEVGFRKPRPEIYLEAIRRANATPRNSVFISHDIKEVKGAEAVGMEGVLADSVEEMIGIT